MAQLTQKDFNETADYYYGLQHDETAHQSNRMMWILAAQTIVFTGACTLIGSSKRFESIREGLNDVLLTLLLIVGVLIALSAVYSSLISEMSIGGVLDDWNHYDSLPIDKKPNPVDHKVIVVPKVLLRSGLRGIAFHTFVPKVFLAAWIVLILYVIFIPAMNPQTVYVLLWFLCALTLVHALTYIYRFIKRMEQRLSFLNQRHTNCSKNPDRGAFENSSCINSHPNGTYSVNKKDEQYFSCHISSCQSNFKLAIYHLMIDRFNGEWTKPPKSVNDFVGGNINGITDKLMYIKKQGYNAIMLTPFYKSASYHGYHITDYEKVDEHFGDWEAFKILVIQAHLNGLKILCDFVPNHCHEQHPFFQDALKNGKKRDWFYFRNDNSYAHFLGHCELPKLNLKNQETVNYLKNVATELALCGVDGIRIDHAIGVPFDFLRLLRASVKRVNPQIIVFGEVLPVDSNYIDDVELRTKERREQIIQKCINQDDLQLDYSDTLDGVLDFVYRDIIINELRNGHNIDTRNLGLMSKLSNHFNKYHKDFHPIIFLDNHDTDRIMFHCKGDKYLLDRIVDFTRNLNMPYCIYYGTEHYMCNQKPLDGTIPYADLEVRNPMDWI